MHRITCDIPSPLTSTSNITMVVISIIIIAPSSTSSPPSSPLPSSSSSHHHHNAGRESCTTQQKRENAGITWQTTPRSASIWEASTGNFLRTLSRARDTKAAPCGFTCIRTGRATHHDGKLLFGHSLSALVCEKRHTAPIQTHTNTYIDTPTQTQ